MVYLSWYYNAAPAQVHLLELQRRPPAPPLLGALPAPRRQEEAAMALPPPLCPPLPAPLMPPLKLLGGGAHPRWWGSW